MTYFASIGLTPPLSLDRNPADFMLSLASTGTVPADDEPSQFRVGIAVSTTGDFGIGIGGSGGDVDGGVGVGVGGGGDGGGSFRPDFGDHSQKDEGVMVAGAVSSGSDDSDNGGVSLDLGIGHVGKDLGAAAPFDYAPSGYGSAGANNTLSSAADVAEIGGSTNDSAGCDRPPTTVAELGRAFSRSPAASEARAAAEREESAGGRATRGRRQGDSACPRRSTLWLSMVLTHREVNVFLMLCRVCQQHSPCREKGALHIFRRMPASCEVGLNT